MVDFPMIHVRRTPQGYAVQGDATQELGTRIPRGEGHIDDGIFATWHWDGSTLVVQNDRYGNFPLYYSADHTQIAVSQSPLRLIASGISAELDHEALAVFLRVGFYLQEDTPFRAIRALPPSATLRWSEGRLHIERDPVRFAEPFTRGPDAAIDEYIERFEAAIARRPPVRPYALHLLSGGRDSRHILLELLRQGTPPDECATIGSDSMAPGTDEAVARDLTAAVGLTHRLLPARSAPFGAFETRRNVLTHFASDEGWWFAPVVEYADETPITCLYDGIGGGVLSGATFHDDRLLDAWDAMRPEVADLVMAQFGADEPTLAAMLTSEERRRMGRDIARERIMAEIERYAGAANPHAQFVFWNRTRRELGIIPYSFPSRPAVFSPFLDHDVFDLLASLPATMFADRQFHTRTIARAYPEFAHVPYASRNAASSRRQRFRGEANLMAFIARTRPSLLPASLRWQVARANGRRAGRRGTYPARMYYLRLLQTVTDGSQAERLLQAA